MRCHTQYSAMGTAQSLTPTLLRLYRSASDQRGWLYNRSTENQNKLSKYAGTPGGGGYHQPFLLQSAVLQQQSASPLPHTYRCCHCHVVAISSVEGANLFSSSWKALVTACMLAQIAPRRENSWGTHYRNATRVMSSRPWIFSRARSDEK